MITLHSLASQFIGATVARASGDQLPVSPLCAQRFPRERKIIFVTRRQPLLEKVAFPAEKAG